MSRRRQAACRRRRSRALRWPVRIVAVALFTCGAALADDEPAAATPAPGQVAVDEEMIATALERALVQEGAIVLPPGTIRIDPSVSYARREADSPVLLVHNEQVIAGQREMRSDRLLGAVTVHIGLPAETQLGLRIPYGYERTSTVTRLGSAGIEDESDTDKAFGDISLIASKGLLREYGGRPELVASVRWDTDTGSTGSAISRGSGFNELTGTLTAAKSQDPLVFVGSVSYTRSFEQDDIQPGRVIGLSFGMVLAASPETSLRFFLDQHFIDKAKRNGQRFAGSNQVMGTFRIGASSMLAPRLLTDVEVGVGLTKSAPDFTVNISFPLRFHLPTRS
jgi:hypothetical protein